MKSNCSLWSILSAFILVCTNSLCPAYSQTTDRDPSLNTPKGSIRIAAVPGTKTAVSEDSHSFQTKTAVIRPYKKANVNAEVEGVVEKVNFEEGDLVEEGQVVVEISPDLFKIMVDRAKERVAVLEIAQERAANEAELKEYLLDHSAATRQEVIRARSDAKMAKHKTAEARTELELAQRDLEKCTVKAPFSGHVVVLYREQYEHVRRFEQLFLIADTSKVYAVANVPDNVLPKVKKGSTALFIKPSGRSVPGIVANIGKGIDPASRTKKVKVLIDNEASNLEMGMVGSLKFLFEGDVLK